ncbi:hypothetical protein LIER_24650 [Lithospermum erythrorhizon]|uniref:Uncharacterized protein n=1 Tax=Lithospermum erythrorhizon TaxID=34254 RepID=A0AAV3R1X4_LITER
MALSVGNANQVSLNQKSVSPPTDPQVQTDILGTLQPPPPPIVLPTDEIPIGDILDEVQTRVYLTREQEIQRQVDQILERDRLVHEYKDRLTEKAFGVEEAYVPHESYTIDDPPYTPMYNPLYTNFMFPEYGDIRSHSYAPSIVQQTLPRVDPNVVMLQELLAA